MKVKEMLELLRMPKKIEFRDEQNYSICYTSSDSSGVIPYLEREIFQWFPLSFSPFQSQGDICILLKDEKEDS